MANVKNPNLEIFYYLYAYCIWPIYREIGMLFQYSSSLGMLMLFHKLRTHSVVASKGKSTDFPHLEELGNQTF